LRLLDEPQTIEVSREAVGRGPTAWRRVFRHRRSVARARGSKRRWRTTRRLVALPSPPLNSPHGSRRSWGACDCPIRRRARSSPFTCRSRFPMVTSNVLYAMSRMNAWGMRLSENSHSRSLWDSFSAVGASFLSIQSFEDIGGILVGSTRSTLAVDTLDAVADVPRFGPRQRRSKRRDSAWQYKRGTRINCPSTTCTTDLGVPARITIVFPVSSLCGQATVRHQDRQTTCNTSRDKSWAHQNVPPSHWIHLRRKVLMTLPMSFPS